MTIQEYLQSLADKKVAVIGVGVSNTPLIRLLRGANIDVTVCDKKDRVLWVLWRMSWRRKGAGCTWDRTTSMTLTRM